MKCTVLNISRPCFPRNTWWPPDIYWSGMRNCWLYCRYIYQAHYTAHINALSSEEYVVTPSYLLVWYEEFLTVLKIYISSALYSTYHGTFFRGIRGNPPTANEAEGQGALRVGGFWFGVDGCWFVVDAPAPPTPLPLSLWAPAAVEEKDGNPESNEIACTVVCRGAAGWGVRVRGDVTVWWVPVVPHIHTHTHKYTYTWWVPAVPSPSRKNLELRTSDALSGQIRTSE